MSFAQTLLAALQRDLPLVLPQVFLAVVATLMLWPADLIFRKEEKGKWAPVTLVVLGIALILVVRTQAGTGFSSMYTVDGLAKSFQILSVVGAMGAVALSQRLLNGLKEQTVEYYALILFSLCGMLFLCGATDFITLYFSLELMAICIYILVAYLRHQERGVEAGLKYFLLGAFSSGILLYGISLLYAATGGRTTNLAEMARMLPVVAQSNTLLVYTGVLMVLVGMGFKVAAVPFHMWSPDAYDGAPTPVTAFMATAPKAAALAAFLRVFGTAFPGLSHEWMQPLGWVAAASMILGNVAAIKQQSMKRLLAYSSIAHVGYMLLGIMSNNGDPASPGYMDGAAAVWLYMAIYVVMTFGAFAVVMHLQGQGEGERIEDFRGLGRRQPLIGFAMMVFLLSLAGIPPLAGFFGKFYLFMLAVQKGHVALVVIAFLTSVVSAFYYLAVVNQMYLKEPQEGEAPATGGATLFIVSAACTLILVGTFFAPKLLSWAGEIGAKAEVAARY